MSFFDSQILHITIFLPVLFALVLAFLPGTEKGQIRGLTFIAMVVDAIFGLIAYLKFDPKGPEFQLEQRLNWMPDFGISFHTGVDGLAISLILLTVFLGPLVVLASWTFIEERTKEFHLALLFLQTAMLGALAAMDIIVFYLFFEAMLIPMYLLIGVWGSEERQMAAVKFFLYTLVGSLLMLVAILGLYFIAQPAGARSFDYAQVYNGLLSAHHELSMCVNAGSCDTATLSPLAAALKVYGPWMFLAFAVAFAVKVPLFPVHTWLPDAHVQAPVAGSMILAGVMLKMGTYGFWRFAVPLFPVAAREYRTAIAVLGVIGIVYGALMCLAQRDIKKLIAYSSVSHLGYCMLGMFAFTAEGATGSAYQMLNHGVSTGALFLLFGMLYERRHTRLIADYGGIARVMPLFTAFFVIVTFSSIAVPGTNGFVGEFLVLLGSFKSSLKMGISVFAATGVILGAAYMLWMVQRVFFGEVTLRENQRLFDLNFREIATTVPFLLLIALMGLQPQPFLDRLNPASDRFVARALFGSAESQSTLEQVKIQAMPLASSDEGKAQPSKKQLFVLNPQDVPQVKYDAPAAARNLKVGQPFGLPHLQQ